MADAIEELGLQPWEAAARYGTPTEKLLNPPPGNPEPPANVMQLVEGTATPAMSLDALPGQTTNPEPMAPPSNNVLQAIGPAPQAAPPTPTPPEPATPVAQQEHPRKRLSVIDTIGRLADVFAKVGGAEALYQPTLDAREDRTIALGDHARQVDMDALKKTLTEQQVAEGNIEPVLAARKRLGTALGALANNPDAAALWPSIAEQAGITDPQQVAAIGAQLQQNPGSAGIFAKALGADIDNLGKNVYFGTGPDGKTVAYQVGPDGNPHILDFSASGVTPSDPIKVVDTGGAQVIVGSGGAPRKILPKTARPDTILTTTTSENNNKRDNATKTTIAGMPARGKSGSEKTDASGDVNAILNDFGIVLNGKKDPVRNLILESTSGMAQNYASKIPGAFGVATKGQEKISRLETIDNALVLALAGGKLGAGVSNADRDFFKEMSGKISDPNRPANQRVAAWEQIKGRLRGIQQRATKNATPAKARPKAQSGWSIVEVK